MSLLKSVALLVIALTFAAPRDVSAQDRYPVRPIHLIVGFAAGSSGDVAARIVGHKLGELFGQQIVVENRPGASSMEMPVTPYRIWQAIHGKTPSAG